MVSIERVTWMVRVHRVPSRDPQVGALGPRPRIGQKTIRSSTKAAQHKRAQERTNSGEKRCKGGQEERPKMSRDAANILKHCLEAWVANNGSSWHRGHRSQIKSNSMSTSKGGLFEYTKTNNSHPCFSIFGDRSVRINIDRKAT